jgi:Family of unknown function (DUF6982)
MPDQRSVMKEYRYLDAKRTAEGLTPDEEVRYARLRDLVGPEVGAGGLGDAAPGAPLKRGFDVGAAAAQLRESLLPAGLRHRPPPVPEEPPTVPEGAVELSSADALASTFAEPPLDPLALETQGWDPAAAQPWDPGAAQDPAAGSDAAAGYDPAAQAGWDPNQPWDPDAYPQDAAGQPYDPQTYDAAAPTDPAAPLDAGAWDPNAGAWDPNAAAYDPNAAAYDPNAAAYDPNAPVDPAAQAAWDPNQPWDPNAPALDAAGQPYDPAAGYDPDAPVDPAAAAYDPNALIDAEGATYDPNQPPLDAAAGAYDPNAPLDPGAAAYSPEAALDPGTAAYDPNAALEPGEAPHDVGAQPEWSPDTAWDPAVAAETYDPSALPDAGAALHAAGLGAELFADPEGPLDALAADASALPPDGWDAAPPPPAPPGDVPLGEYDEQGAGLALGEDAGLSPAPFEPREAAANAPGDAPQSYAAPLGEYDDTAGFMGEIPADAGIAADGSGFEAAQTVAGAEGAAWQTDAPLDEEFRLASGGSFAAGAEADALPDVVAPPPWQSAPTDLGAPFETPISPEEPGYEIAPTRDADTFAAQDAASYPGDPSAPFDPAGFVEPEPSHLSGPAPELDFSRPELSAEEAAFVEGAAPAEPGTPDGALGDALAAAAAAQDDAELLDFAVDAEEIPMIDGAEILEELPPDEGAAPPQSLEFEPLVHAAATEAAEPAPAAAADPEPAEPAPVDAPLAPPTPAPFHVAGSHRVVVHTVEGHVKRGVLQDADLAGPTLVLAAQVGGAEEMVATEKVKAIFFMLSPGEKAPVAEGRKVRVTFRDGRQVAGFSPDYVEDGAGFFMIPGDTRTNTGRIWVYRSAVRQVAVS